MSKITLTGPETGSSPGNALQTSLEAKAAQMRFTDNENLQSTLMSKGSGSVSEHVTTINVEDWAPHMKRDVEPHSTCNFIDMLQEFLVMALPEELRAKPPANLLQKCLRAVLPICNGQSNRSTKPRLEGTIRSHLLKYCQTTVEKQRYDPFTKAMNVALDYLKTAQTPLRKVSEDDPQFYLQRQDEVPIFGRHDSQRKPDVLGADEKTPFAHPTVGAEIKLPDVKQAHLNPTDGYRISWCPAPLPCEFKKEAHTITPPPEKYNLKAVFKQVPHQKLTASSTAKASSQESPSDDMADTDGLPLSEPSNDDIFFSPQIPGGIIFGTRRRQLPPPASSRSRKSDKQWGSAMVQVAAYAAELFYAVPGASHAVGIVIHDSVAWVWWFDRQGAIQSGGVDFIQHLPYFLVLLLAFQRITKRTWRPSALHGDTLSLRDGVTITIPWDHPIAFKQHFGLAGRGTCVVPVQVTSRDQSGSTTLEGQRFIAKISWQETERTSEVVILERAEKAAASCDKIRGHIPVLVGSRDFPDVHTERIRTAFHASPSPHGSRHLRLLAFHRLQDITNLVGEKFWLAFRAIFVCHRHLWINGIRHRDISPSNMMYYLRDDEPVGVLNDFDLSSLADCTSPLGQRRTGTLPFLALDFLNETASKGHVEHLYRHDAEAFLWALAWICVRYKLDSKKSIQQRDSPFLHKWFTGTLEECHDAKLSFLYDPGRAQPSNAHTGNFTRYKNTLGFQKKLVDIAGKRALGELCDEPSDQDVFEGIMVAFGEEVKNSCDCVGPK